MAESEIIGREEQLDFLKERLHAVSQGPTAAVVLEGDAGIGKTTLVQAALRAALAREYRVLASRPAASEVQLSYAALSDLLEGVLPEIAPSLPTPQRCALEIALRLREADPAASDPRTIALAFLNVMRELARSRPLVVAVDDVQWIDPPTAAVLEFAARRLDLEPLLFLFALRREPKRELRLDLERTFAEGRLSWRGVGPLSLGALNHLVRKRLGITLVRPDLVRLHEASGGNPYYALEIARYRELQTVRIPAGQPLPMPDTLAELVDERLETLPAPVRCVLEAAAALSEPTVSVVAAASVGEDEISAPLEAALAARVIALDGDHIRFTHPLVAASAYSSMAPPRQRKLHRRLASLVRDPEARARHLALGTDGPREEVAAAAEEAARHAAARGAPSSAAELCEISIRLTPSGRPSSLRARKLAAVHYYLASGETLSARDRLETLRDEVPPGEERADVLLLLARLMATDKQALALLEEAATEAAGDARRLIRIHQILGDWWSLRGDSVQYLSNHRRALALAEASGDHDGVVMAITSLVMAEGSTGQRTPGLLERAFALEQEAVDEPFRVYSLRAALALMRVYRGELAQARALLEELLAAAAAHGDEWGRMNGTRILAMVELREGNWVSATRHIDEACELCMQLTGVQAPAVFYVKALIDAHLGRVDNARSTAEEGTRICERVEHFHGRIQHQAVLGFIELSLGDPERADRIFRPLLDQLAASGWALELHFPSGDPLEALIAVGDLGRAHELIAQFEGEADVVGSPFEAACTERLRGLLYSAEGDLPEALAAFERALAAQESNGWPFERARTLLALGQTQRRAKRKRVARESLQAALALFEQLGAQLWMQQAKSELARISGRPPASGELTPTEERVAKLVAEGRSNRETAAALYLSKHTVEGHLSRIYAKLGVRSRTELAHRLAAAAPPARDS